MLSSLLALGASGGALAAFPQDKPNDPEFEKAERDCVGTSVSSEEAYHYARMSACTPNARDPENAAGMSTERAWREVTAGSPDVVIAYVEGGVNWFEPEAKDFVNQTYLNAKELPAPTTPVDDGRLNVKDFDDSKDANGNGYVDPEDLIVRFSDGKDDDANGYTDDISGWDFYDDQNNPATYDGAYEHANNQMRQAAAEPDNRMGGVGVCPRCTVLPIKAGAEALDRTDDLAEAWLYAADAGSDVIVSVTADLGYSTFMKQAVENIWHRGVVMVEASNDFNSTDHQGGAFHPHVIPANAVVANARGVNAPAGNLATTTFRARSGFTSWGTKNFTSVASSGGTTSEAVPTHGGGFALVLAAGAARGVTAAEAIQITRATASDISGDTNWPSKPGFDLQFGYGRPNLFKAAKAAADGDIPPVAWIESPDWYALFDPTKTKTIDVAGHVEAKRSSGYTYKLEVAPGAEPSDGGFRTIGEAGGSAVVDGKLGTLDLSTIPQSFWSRAMELSKDKTLESNERYTVTFRLRVTDAEGRLGEDRRTIAVHRDPTWLDGFPKKIGPGGEAQPVLADLQGRGSLAAVFGDSDGVVHAIDGRTAEELPGWPVKTDATKVTRAHPGIAPGNEPVINSAAVGDLDGDGKPSVVVATTTGRVYVFDERGKRRKGWPRTLDAGVAPVESPRKNRPYTRLPAVGSSAPPVLVDLAGDSAPEIVQAGWNGRVHVWKADGSDVAGWPVRVNLDGKLPPTDGRVRVNDQKLVVAPAVANLDGKGRPELVVRSQEFDTSGPDLQLNGTTHVHAFDAAGKPVAGWPRKLPSVAVFYGSAQEFITEGAGATSAADIDGDGDDEVTISPLFSPVTVLDGDGSTKTTYGPLSNQASAITDRERLLSGQLPPDAPVSFTTSGAFGRFGGGLTYAEPGSGLLSVASSLLTPGSGRPITNHMRAFDARTGTTRGGFPDFLQGLDFLGAPIIADVTGDGEPEVIEGGDTSAMHAYRSGGGQAADFPKFTTGWVLWAPSTGDIDGDGTTDLVAMTREGYLMAWRTKGKDGEGNSEWWSYRHDERNTSRYGTDTRPPGVPRDVALSADGRELSFTVPGDDWYGGKAAAYVVATPRDSARRVAATNRAGERHSVELAAGTRSATVAGVDDAGNVGRTAGAVAGRRAACTSRRAVRITLPRGRYRSARAVGAGKTLNVRRRGRVLTVTLRGLPKTRITVRITAQRAGSRRAVRVTRTYRTCAPRKK